MRIVLGFLRADEGTVTWLGRDARDWPRRTWGYMPEERGLYLRMPVLDQLVFFASLYGVPRDAGACGWRSTGSRASGSPIYADRRAESLSKGNQQKVQFIATVLHDPDVLLMDEPFSGLDPVNVALLKSAFLEMRDRGKTLVFSTHQLDHGRGAVRLGRDHRPRTARRPRARRATSSARPATRSSALATAADGDARVAPSRCRTSP